MNEPQVTLIGWIAAEPYFTVTGNGHPFLSLRVGVTPRRLDRQTGQWQDTETMFFTVNCWRGLADNVNASEFKRGQPVIVTGRLRVRQYERDGNWRFSAEVDAITVGHDLSRGTAHFRPVQRGALNEEDRREAQAVADQWALSATPPTGTDESDQSDQTAEFALAGEAAAGDVRDGDSDHEEARAA
jgi:single-strand DNA-binding protein